MNDKPIGDFGLAPIKGEGMISDPDEYNWKCDCARCEERYRHWKNDFDAEQKALAQQALDKKAENARELGLDYEPAQKPVFLDWYDNAHWGNEDFKEGCWRAWDAALAQRKPLTDEAIATVYWGATGQSLRPQDNVLAHNFARSIEAAHGIKENT